MKLHTVQAMRFPAQDYRQPQPRVIYAPAPPVRPAGPTAQELAHARALEERRRWEQAQLRERAREEARERAQTEARERARLEAHARAQADARERARLEAQARTQAEARERAQALARERSLRASRDQVRDQRREQSWDEVQNRADQRFEQYDQANGGFLADPWADEFGDATTPVPGTESTSANTVLEPQVVPMQTVSVAPPPAQVAPLQVSTPQTAIVVSDGYGPLSQMSRNLRIQAAEGFRAGVIKLKNGMYLVVEIAKEALEPEFGVAEVLAPLVFNAAAKVLSDEDSQKAIMSAASQGVHAMGRGITHLVEQRHQPQQKPRARTQSAPRHQVAMRQPGTPWPGYYPMIPPGYALVPQTALLPTGQGAVVQARQPMGQTALPWADADDFAGLDLDWDGNG